MVLGLGSDSGSRDVEERSILGLFVKQNTE